MSALQATVDLCVQSAMGLCIGIESLGFLSKIIIYHGTDIFSEAIYKKLKFGKVNWRLKTQ